MGNWSSREEYPHAEPPAEMVSDLTKDLLRYEASLEQDLIALYERADKDDTPRRKELEQTLRVVRCALDKLRDDATDSKHVGYALLARYSEQRI